MATTARDNESIDVEIGTDDLHDDEDADREDDGLFQQFIHASTRFSSQDPDLSAASFQNRGGGDGGGRKTHKEQLGYSWRAACAECTVPPHMRNVRIMIIFVLTFIFVTFVWIGVLYKAFADSTQDYLQHFTNWMWTFAAIYYTLDLVSMLMVNRFLESMLLFWLWWIYFSNVMVVFWLVFIMVYDNPRVITDEFESNGGDYYAGLVLVADKVFHIIPELFAVVYLGFRIPDFVDVFHIEFTPTDDMSLKYPMVAYITMVKRVIVYLILLTCVACPLVILTYYNMFDINQVYEVDTPVYLGVLVIMFSIASSTVAPVLLLSPLGIPSRKRHPLSWSTSIRSPSRQDKAEYTRDVEISKQFVRENSRKMNDEAFEDDTQ